MDASVEESYMDDVECKELVDPAADRSRVKPNDDYRIVYFLFYLYGLTSMMPWSFFVTANDYWMYKFRDITPQNSSLHIGKTAFQAEFTAYLNVASCLPSTLCLILNSLYGHLVPLSIRMNVSLVLITIFFLLTTILVQVNTDDWQDEFFIVTMITVVIINAAGAVFGGSLMGIAGRFDPKYMAAVINGQALGGIIAAVAQILSLAFKVSAVHSAIIYFAIGDVIILFSVFSYLLLTKMEYFKYHVCDETERRPSVNRASYTSSSLILKKIRVYSYSLTLVFLTTTCVYPGITVLVESHHSGKGGDWNTIFFVPVVNYLIYNCGDYTGRVIAGLSLKPKKKSWIVATIATMRVALVPLLMLCNAQPRKKLPVVIGSDWEYILLITAFAFSNGYITNISMINAARIVEHHEKEKASSLMAASLGMGITLGASLGMGLVKLL